MPDNRFSQFMQGRLGSDELNLCLSALGTFFVLINVFATTRVLTVLALIFLLVALVRALLPAAGVNESLNSSFLGLFGGKGGRSTARNRDYADSYESNPYLDDDFEDTFESDETEEPAEQESAPAEPEQPVYAHLECPECHQHMRVPVGMGRVLVTCPACGNKFESES